MPRSKKLGQRSPHGHSEYDQLPHKKQETKATPKRVIIDCDPGTDDAWALFMLLEAHRDPNLPVKVEAITITFGNTTLPNVEINLGRILTTIGVKDVPIYRGASKAMGPGFHDDTDYNGEDGFGDAKDLPTDKAEIQENETAAQAIVRLLKQNPGEITLITLGPSTNFALVLQEEPDAHGLPKEMFLLGGNHEGRGNVSGIPTAEFNFASDPVAAKKVLEGFTCPKTLVPLETWEDHATLEYEFRKEVLGGIKSAKVDLLNKIEAMNLARHTDGWNSPDSLIAALFLKPKIATAVLSSHCTVESEGVLTRGMMVVDRHGVLGKPPNVCVVTKVNKALYEKMLLKTAKDSN